MTILEDILLAIHVGAGTVGLAGGPVLLWAGDAFGQILRDARARMRPRPRVVASIRVAYRAAIVVVVLTAVALVALDPSDLWWLLLLAALTLACLVIGELAPTDGGRAWQRARVHGQGGAYIALVTATLVVSVSGPLAPLAWVLPTAVGLPLIELRVAERRGRRDPRADPA